MTSRDRARLALVEPAKRPQGHISTYLDEKYAVMWCYMHASPRPCFTRPQLAELQDSFERVKPHNARNPDNPVEYFVLASDINGVYNLGGDLDLFRELIVERDRDALLHYATSCIDALYLKMTGFDCGVTHIALVQGDALGGGFECALASDVLVAERGTKFGLPEIMFNLFPGMGAYSILSRKLTPSLAKRIILSGRLYTAEELYEMGVVDVLAEEYQGEMAVYDCIRQENRSSNGIRSFRNVARRVDPVTYQELLEVTTAWVDAALNLDRRDLRIMERLVARQTKPSIALAKA